MYGLVFAILSPIIWALAYLYDKYVLMHRERRPLRYGVLIGIANLTFAALCALFLDWSGTTFHDFLFPVLAGTMLAIDTFLYLLILHKEDAATMVGLLYSYPIIVAILSFLFLNEKISLVGYAGIILMMLGTILLSVRANKLRLKIGAWLIVANVVVIALTEFFAKISTTNMNGWQAFSVNSMVYGAVLICALVMPTVRQGFVQELKRNMAFAYLGELFTIGATLTMYLAMTELSVTVVATLQTLQVIMVVFFERFASFFFTHMEQDHKLLPKLGSITLIVIGTILLYSTL